MKRAFLFTGQGSQFVGMGKDLVERFPIARETFAEAEAALGEPLLSLCVEGPEEQLGLTENTQPATLTVAVAAFRALGLTPGLAAGHSLGEYSAHVAAGTFAFADAVRLVRRRAQFMQTAVPVGTGGMVVLRKMGLDEVQALVEQVDAGVCEIANVNEPEQIVVSGAIAAMDQIVSLAPPRKALKLNVSVPFHCSLLQGAGAEFAKVLDETAMNDPAFPIWCNVDASPVTTAAAARSALQRQFAGSVLWLQTVHGMLDAGVRDFVECGPKPTLVNMVKRIAAGKGVDGVQTQAATTADEIAALAGAVSGAADAMRQALWPLGLLYGGVAAVRNWCFDAGIKKRYALDVPVVSIGNLTVGGTGKTPTVAWLAGLAKAAGRRPGVLARGYGRAPGAALNDEGTMLQRQLPWLLQEQDPDRVAAGRRLVAKGADFVILDDGFQHRRLRRDLDLVCLDATLPFGNGQCLPAGDLREFRSGLRRAGLLLLTRAGGLDAQAIEQRVRRLREIAHQPALPVYATDHAPADLVSRPDDAVLPLSSLRGRRVVLLSAIARPQSFRATCAGLGAEVVNELRYRDHHRFTADELQRAAAAARAADAVLLTTAKDDARLGDAELPRQVLRVALRFLGPEPPAAELLL